MVLPDIPKEIEAKSFEIIQRYTRGIRSPVSARPIVNRVIHATADIGYARRMLFHPAAVKAGIGAINKGKTIVVDANMVKAGINKKLLKAFGCRLICRLDSERVAKRSSVLSLTRSSLAMSMSAGLMKDGIVVVGNAPTALFKVCEMIKEENVRPALVVGVPVGFVGAAQAKQKLRALDIPYITNRGRRGGSAVAVAIVNALLIMAQGERR